MCPMLQDVIGRDVQGSRYQTTKNVNAITHQPGQPVVDIAIRSMDTN